MSRGKQYSAALLSNGVSSLGNVILTVIAARGSAATEFGKLAAALVGATLAIGVVRAAILEPQLVKEPNPVDGFTRLDASLRVAAFILAPLMAIVGLLASNWYLVIVALATPGLVAYDYLRTYWLSFGPQRRSVWMDVAWTIPMVILAVSSIRLAISPVVALAIWAGVAQIVAVIAWRLFARTFARRRTSARKLFNLSYAVDYLVGSGSTQLSLSALATFASPNTVGALRAAGTVLSPVNLLASAARPIALVHLGMTARIKTRSVTRDAAVVAVALVVVGAPVALAAANIPDGWGTALLGPTWALASAAIVPLALDALIGLSNTLAFTGLRAYESSRSILINRAGLAAFRVVGISIAGILGGPIAAAWSIPAVSTVGAFVWWTSLIRSSRAAQKRELTE